MKIQVETTMSEIIKLGLDTVEGWSESTIVASAPTDGNSRLCEDLIIKVMKLGYKSYIWCNTTKPETTLVEYQVRQKICYFLTCQNFQKKNSERKIICERK